METKAIKAAITSIENQLEILKSACGLTPGVGEEAAEQDNDDVEEVAPRTRAARRGRHRLMPKFEEESD